MPLGFMPVELGLRNIKERRNNLKKRILALTTSILVVLAVLIVPLLVLAGNEATQEASTSSATAISIKSQNYTSAVSTITFPEDAPGATVSVPYNDVDDTGSPQVLGGSPKPVVTLVNSASVVYNIWYNITDFTNSIVSSENYTIIAKDGACANEAAINQTVILDGSPHVTTGTITTINATGDGGEADKRDLYLKIVLSDVAGKSGTSTITILGETA